MMSPSSAIEAYQYNDGTRQRDWLTSLCKIYEDGVDIAI